MIENNFISVSIAVFLAAAVNTLGIYVTNKFSDRAKNYMIYFISYAAGVLVTVSFIHLIPESFEKSEKAPVFLLSGFFLFYLIDKFIVDFFRHKQHCENCAFGIVPVLGIGFHSLVDGIIFSVTFNVSILTGALAATGMVLHEFPEGVVTYLLLMKSGFNKRKSSIYAFFAVALSTPVGAIISWPFISRLTDSVLGFLLSLSAGALIYVGATHLLPETQKETRRFCFLSLIAGIATAIFIIHSGSH